MAFLEKLGLDSLADLPALADFVPGADVVETLEQTLRPSPAGAESTDRVSEAPEGVRLQKVLALHGFGSRHTCDDLIAAGRVTVNGEIAELGRRVDVSTAAIAVDGVPVSVRPGTCTTC